MALGPGMGKAVGRRLHSFRKQMNWPLARGFASGICIPHAG